MLAFDIETFGLDPHTDDITVVALYGTLCEGGPLVDTVLNFQRCRDQPGRIALCKTLTDLMDSATTLVAFNGHRFDIPFIMTALGVPAHRCEKWLLKLYDPFEESKLINDRGTKLCNVLRRLGLQDKTASGLEAVHMARRGEWDTLEDYCRTDARLTHEASGLLLKLSQDAIGQKMRR